MNDFIQIHGLELRVSLGVPDDERASPQRVVANLMFWPSGGAVTKDEIRETVDYAAVAAETTRFAASCSYKLLETTTDRLALHLLETFTIEKIVLELRKFPLSSAEYVSVTVERSRSGA